MDTNENQECSINKYSNSEDTNYDDYQDTIEGDHKLPEKDNTFSLHSAKSKLEEAYERIKEMSKTMQNKITGKVDENFAINQKMIPLIAIMLVCVTIAIAPIIRAVIGLPYNIVWETFSTEIIGPYGIATGRYYVPRYARAIGAIVEIGFLLSLCLIGSIYI